MATNARKQAPIVGIAIPIATPNPRRGALAAQAAEDNALALLHDGFALVCAVSLHRHLCSRLAMRPY
jgi:hypothetical protein